MIKEVKPIGRRIAIRGKNTRYLLGTINGTRYYLETPSWDCGWYWGFGYVAGFGDYGRESHQHFDGLFLKDFAAGPMGILDESPLSERERWQLCDLLKTAYTFRNVADAIHLGGSHISAVPGTKTLLASEEDTAYRKRINEIILPAIFKEVETLFTREYTYKDLLVANERDAASRIVDEFCKKMAITDKTDARNLLLRDTRLFTGCGLEITK